MSAGTNNELMLDVHDLSESSTGEKRKREGKFRSKAWDHFTKLIKEDGTYEKCKCNHCHKLFTCSSKSGTTHLLRHITEGICPVFKKEKRDGTPSALAYLRGSSEPRGSVLPWKYDQGSSQQIDGQDPLLPVSIDDDIENQTSEGLGLGLGEDYGDQATTANLGKLPQLGGLKSQPRGESWLNEFRACVKRLVDLTNEGVPKGSAMKPCSAVAAPDYSIATALRFLNEMDDIPQSSEMYLDAFELLKDAGERECFICLPPEPRRRWLQRMLHRQHPLRYAYSF
ncbi:hypothetical protein M9H77_21747 [Catharanthus roseus]|uniref:Uncharacterized protein n=1 Tax=Catharanthus roseus TaxID=4058 RepID=A0ACC0ANK7_CATRO|nr:hypothetical protein M9H77_21747 [Catharanthus roseus]